MDGLIVLQNNVLASNPCDAFVRKRVFESDKVFRKVHACDFVDRPAVVAALVGCPSVISELVDCHIGVGWWLQKMQNKACELTADNALLGFGATFRR